MRINYPRDDRDGWRRFVPSWKLVLGTLAALMGVGVVVGLVFFVYVWLTVDIPEENEVAAAQTSIVYWDDGETEMARLGDTNRILVPLSDVPEHMRYAVIAAEDRNFYEHWGVDVVGLARAVINNVTGGTTQGGSTITQQYAKNAFLTSEQTYIRKIKELILALKLEAQLSKDEILERYLNTIFYGRGAYGVETAAEAYFRANARDLTLEQAAVLASVINAPGLYNPDTEDGLAKLENRYAYVLNGMVEEGWLSAQERDAALEEFPKIAKRRSDQKYAGPRGYLLRAVNDQLLALGFTEQEINAGGLRIVSTFDKARQKAAEEAVAEQAPTTGMEGVRIGLIAVEPVTGEVAAMYGGADYLENSFNNATQARYQAGSTFKPFGLVAATDAGIGLDSMWPGNSPTQVSNYEVNNYGDNSYGELVTLLKGTEQSINTVYVSVEYETGVPPVQEAAINAGIPADTPGWTDDLTFVLGTPSPRTIDVANAYATFAARGERANTTTFVRTVGTASGGLLYEHEQDTSRTIDENTADVVNYALQSVVQNGTGAPARALGRPVAAKTGTTDEYRSSWFSGYVPQLAAAVSFGKSGPNGEELSLSGTGGMPAFYGSGFPARIWTAFMKAALADTPVEDFVAPAEIPSGGGVATVEPSPTQATPTAPATPTATPTPTPTAPPSQTPEPPAETTAAPEPPPETTAAPEPPVTQPTEPGNPGNPGGGQGPGGGGPPGQQSSNP